MKTKIEKNEILQLLPEQIAKSKQFTPKNKFLLATLLYLNGLDKVKSDGYFFRTNLMLSKEANIAEKNLLINLRKLEQLNFMSRKAGKRGEASEYIVNEKNIFDYIETKVSDNSKVSETKVSNNKVSNNKVSEMKVSNKPDSKVSDKVDVIVLNANDLDSKVSDKVSETKVSDNKVSETKVSETKVSNKLDSKVSDKLDIIMLRMSKLEDLLLQFIAVNQNSKVSNEKNIKVSTDTDTETETEINKKNNILNNINNNIKNNILEKNYEIESDKECYASAAHSNYNDIKNNSKSFSFDYNVGEKSKDAEKGIGAEQMNTSTENVFSSDAANDNSSIEQSVASAEKVLDNAGKQVGTNIEYSIENDKECFASAAHSNNDIKNVSKSFSFDCIGEENNTDAEQMNTSTESVFSSSGLKDNSSIEQSVVLTEKVLDNAGKDSVENDKECYTSAAHSNYYDFDLFVKEFNQEEEESRCSKDAEQVNTSTEMPFSSSGLKDNSSIEQSINEEEIMQEIEAIQLKEDSIKNDKECYASATHSNNEIKNNSKSFSFDYIGEEKGVGAEQMNTSTEMPLSSVLSEDNSSIEQSTTQEKKVLDNAGKRIVEDAEKLVEKLSMCSSQDEIVSKAYLYVDWLEKKKNQLNDETIYQSLMDMASDIFLSTLNQINGVEVDAVEEDAVEVQLFSTDYTQESIQVVDVVCSN